MLIIATIEISQDNGFAEIIYQVEWETLPLDIQKDIMHLINQKQNVSGIKLGPFGMGINRDIFKVVCYLFPKKN